MLDSAVKELVGTMDNDEKQTYTTARGVTVEFLPIPRLLDKLQAARAEAMPKPPTYKVEVIGGRTEEHEHDEKTIAEPDTPEADKQAWAQYKEKLAELDDDYNSKLARLVLTRGIRYEPHQNGDWVAEHEWLGLHVPDDPRERALHYIETEVIGGQADIQEIILGVWRASGVPEELISQIEAAFQRALGRAGGNQAGESDSAEGPVVVQRAARRSRRGTQGRASA